MKNATRKRLIWVTIFILLTAIIIFYKNMTDRYLDLGKNAPMPTELNPIVEKKKNELITMCSEKGIYVVITESLRSVKRQNELYAQGRTKNGDIVTYAKGGESYHNYGLAVDFALLNEAGKIIWDIHYDGNGNGKPDWFEVASAAKKLGFTWGGDWSKFKDYPHLQIDFGLSINQLKRGFRPKNDQSNETNK